MRRYLIAVVLVAVFAGGVWSADEGVFRYQTPPQVMVDLVDAPPTPSVSLSPDRKTLLMMERSSLPPIAELAEPELRLAGLRINPQWYGPSRSIHYRKLTLVKIADGSQQVVSGLPADARVEDTAWSADSRFLAFSVAGESEMQLWVADVAAARARRLEGVRLNASHPRTPFVWVSDKHELLCRLVPAGQGELPAAPAVPEGPEVQETSGGKAAARTYQDLLKTAHDEDLFRHLMQTQIARVSLDGKVTKLGEPGLYSRAEASPDGNYVLVEEVREPFSRLVPVYRFADRIAIWDAAGKTVREVADLPRAEQVPIGNDAVPTGPRNVDWRADAPASLGWLEARDGGDPERRTAIRDEVMALDAPFAGEPKKLFSGGLRVRGIQWGNERLALVSEFWWSTRREKTWAVRPDSPGAEAKLLFDRSFEDRYGDPGDPVNHRNRWGQAVLQTAGDGDQLFFTGDGASDDGDRPFVDAFNWESKDSRRLWRSQAPYHEAAVAVLDDAGKRILTRRESVNEPPNYFVRDLETGEARQLTHFPHPSPRLAKVTKELIRYKRADGVDLTAELYLPPGYTPAQGPLPLLMWAYPREFKSADAASQVVGSPYEFVQVTPGSPLFWLTQGYAVLDGPTMPIVGEGTAEPNDTYVKQLVASAQAAADEVVRRGVADRDRLAIGGHSYGAFMTANLLAHSDIFRAGIAESGAYNRTLTPFGFQAEERTYWQAPEVYFAMSPFMHAQDVNEPILLIHGIADNNAGTFPIQSERFYHALKGHGATARLVMLPLESHGYRGRESVLHVLWEKTQWLDKYVKNARPRAGSASAGRN